MVHAKTFSTMMPSYVKEAAAQEIHWMRWALRIVVGLYVVFTAGQSIEAHLAPVFRNVTVDNIRVDGSRLCFVLHWDKARRARGVFYVAQVYEGDNLQYLLRGIEHYEGEAYGGRLQGAPLAHYDSDTCVDISKNATDAYRMGVRILARFEVPYRPWLLDQPEIWVDAYKGIHY